MGTRLLAKEFITLGVVVCWAFVWCFRSHYFNEEKKRERKGRKRGGRLEFPQIPHPADLGSFILICHHQMIAMTDRSIDHSALATQRPHPAITPSIGVANLFVVMQTSRHKGRIIPASHFTVTYTTRCKTIYASSTQFRLSPIHHTIYPIHI